jgi:hypothetical protein
MNKNTNAKLSDLIQALHDDQLVLLAIDGKLCRFATDRTKRQDAKKAFAENKHVVLSFGHLRWAGDYKLELRDLGALGVVVVRHNLPGEAASRVFSTFSEKRREIEAESECIKAARLLGASYKGNGLIVLADGRKVAYRLCDGETAERIRDAILLKLAEQVKEKPEIDLTIF